MPNRYLSPAMHGQDALSLIQEPLTAAEARIYNGIWNAVIVGQLRPGSELSADTLCEIYGTTPGIISKAIAALDQDGIVAVAMNGSARIYLPLPSEARDLFDTVRTIATQIARRLAQRASDIPTAQRDMLDAHALAEEQAIEQNNAAAVGRLRLEYGTLLALIHGNRILAREHERNLNRFALVLLAYNAKGRDGLGTSDHTRSLNQMLLSGNGDAAARAIAAVLEKVSVSMRFDLDDSRVDLKALLNSGTGR